MLQDIIESELACRYCLLFGSRGANVVVNDFNAAAAQAVVDEIKAGALYFVSLDKPILTGV